MLWRPGVPRRPLPFSCRRCLHLRFQSLDLGRENGSKSCLSPLGTNYSFKTCPDTRLIFPHSYVGKTAVLAGHAEHHVRSPESAPHCAARFSNRVLRGAEPTIEPADMSVGSRESTSEPPNLLVHRPTKGWTDQSTGWYTGEFSCL